MTNIQIISNTGSCPEGFSNIGSIMTDGGEAVILGGNIIEACEGSIYIFKSNFFVDLENYLISDVFTNHLLFFITLAFLFFLIYQTFKFGLIVGFNFLNNGKGKK